MKIVVSILITLLFGPVLPVHAQGDTTHGTFVIKARKPIDLNNKTFHIKLIQTKGKKGQRSWKWDDDELVFKKDMLLSTLMNKMERYPAATYFATIDSANADAVKFKMFSQNPDDAGARIRIEGKVTGDHIEGTASWLSRIGTYYYKFSGNLEKNTKKGKQ